MKIALFCGNKLQFDNVFKGDIPERLAQLGEVSPPIGKDGLEANRAFLAGCEAAFSTWGMPTFTAEEIKEYMPALKVLFYCAGTVQYFAKPFLDCGVRVFSAYAANAVPVIEFASAQIMLAAKGYFLSGKCYRLSPAAALLHAHSSHGNFKSKVGLIGLGSIGGGVAAKLKDTDVEVYAYDPFASEEKARSLGVTLKPLEWIFAQCDVISNHLANKKELNNILSYKLFSSMKKHSTFINTGRGAQVSEWGLYLSLLLHPSRAALIDVLKHDFFPYISPLFWCPNAFITPHIAGSMGFEPVRMAEYMITEFENYRDNLETHYEVTADMLQNMA